MGRKSKAKKIKKQKQEKVEVKSNKKLIKKTAEKISHQISLNGKKIFGGIFSLIMLVILVCVGYLLFQKAFRAEPIAKLLPAENTVLLTEINTDFNHTQVTKAFELLKNHSEYSKEKLLNRLDEKFQLNYEKDLKNWFGRQIGMALVNSQKRENGIYTFYFSEISNQQSFQNFLNSKNTDITLFTSQPTDYKNQKIYSLQGPFYLTQIRDYVVLSSTEEAVKELIDFQKSKDKKLYNDLGYRRIDDNLPINKAALAYIDFDNIDDRFFQHFAFLGEQGLSMQILEPFLKVFSSEGFALVSMDDNFAIQSFLNMDEEAAKDVQYFSSKQKYLAKLTNYLSANTLAFWGGENFGNQIKRIMEVLSGGNNATFQVFDQILQNYTQKYFDPGVNFNNDIATLIDKEFIFAIEKSAEKNIYKFLIEFDSPQTEALKLQELASGFASAGAIFQPKLVEHTLADGTTSKEIVALPEEITREEINYKDLNIFHLRMGERNWGIYYAFIDNIAVISSELEGVKTTIDLSNNPQSNFQKTTFFPNNITPLLRSSDEVSYFNFQQLLPILFKDKPAPEFFNIIDSFSSGRNYFNDGIVSINYLHLK